MKTKPFPPTTISSPLDQPTESAPPAATQVTRCSIQGSWTLPLNSKADGELCPCQHTSSRTRYIQVAPHMWWAASWGDSSPAVSAFFICHPHVTEAHHILPVNPSGTCPALAVSAKHSPYSFSHAFPIFSLYSRLHIYLQNHSFLPAFRRKPS